MTRRKPKLETIEVPEETLVEVQDITQEVPEETTIKVTANAGAIETPKVVTKPVNHDVILPRTKSRYVPPLR